MEKNKKNEDGVQNLKDILSKAKKVEDRVSETEYRQNLPKELSDMIKWDKDERYPMKESIYHDNKTDFASRGRQVKIKFSLKGWKGLINKIKKSKFINWVKKMYRNLITLPIENIINKRREKNFKKDTIKGFSKSFNVKHDRMLKLMNTGYGRDGNELHSKEIMEHLSENAKLINEVKKDLGPTLYVPEVVELHNEFLNPNNPTFKEIKDEEVSKTKKLLEKQGRFLNRKG